MALADRLAEWLEVKRQVEKELRDYPFRRVSTLGHPDGPQARLERVRAGLEALPPPWRRLLELKYLQGLPNWQVAQELHISERTLLLWQNKALERMALALGLWEA